MTELAVRDETALASAGNGTGPTPAMTELVQWAYEARQAHQIAQSLAATSFVPKSLRCEDRSLTPEQRDAVTASNITAAILTGAELGIKPMAALRSTDIIYGTPALRAHTMRGLVQSHGHEIEPVVQTDERVVWRGRRKGSQTWVEVEWTIDRAKQLGAYGRNDSYKSQPKTMLNARATGELSRIIDADGLLGMPYAAEELDAPLPGEPGAPAVPVTTEEITGAARAAQPPAAPPPARPDEAATPPPPDKPTSDSPPDAGMVSPDERRERNRLHAILGGKGIDLNAAKRRDDKISLLSDLAGRAVDSSDDLTYDELRRINQVLSAIANGAETDRPLAIAEHVEAGRKLRAAAAQPPLPTPDGDSP